MRNILSRILKKIKKPQKKVKYVRKKQIKINYHKKEKNK